MKKALNTIFILNILFALNATTTFADTEINKRAKIVLEHVEPGQTLALVTDYGQILYKENISLEGKYVKFLDLSPLPNGTYRIELEKFAEITVIPVVVDNNEAVILYDNSNVYNKPIIKVTNESVYVSKINFDHEAVSVKFYYDSDHGSNGENLIFKESLGDASTVERAYKLSNTEKGNYRVVVSAGDRTFTKNIKI